MCDPFTIASIAIPIITGAGSSIMQNKAAEQQASQQRTAQKAFQGDIEQRRNIANVEFQDSIKQSGLTQMQDAQNQSIQDRTELSQPSFNQESLLPSQGNSSAGVKTAIVQDQARAVKDTQSAAKRQAILDSFGDADLKRNIALKQNADRIGTQGHLVGGALDNLDAGLNAAKYAGSGANNTALLLNALGQAGSSYAGSKIPSNIDPVTGLKQGTITLANQGGLYG